MARLFVLHLAIVIYYIIAWRGVIQIRFENVTDKRLLRLESLRGRFLTNWNFGMQTAMFFGYLVHDIIRLFGNTVHERSSFKKKLDFFFCSISAPLSIFVSVVFWGLYLFNRELVFPTIIDKIMPSWVNHALHTIIVLNVLLHMYVDRQPSPTLRHSMYAFTAIKLCYFICLYATYYEKGIWVYPFLEKLHEPLRILSLLVLFGFSLLCVTAIHYTNNWLYGLVRKPVSQRVSEKKKKLG